MATGLWPMVHGQDPNLCNLFVKFPKHGKQLIKMASSRLDEFEDLAAWRSTAKADTKTLMDLAENARGRLFTDLVPALEKPLAMQKATDTARMDMFKEFMMLRLCPPSHPGTGPRVQGPRAKGQGPRAAQHAGQAPRPKAQGPRPQGRRPKAQGPRAQGPRAKGQGISKRR